jgi:ABC-2 type transport system ATP-binding protein
MLRAGALVDQGAPRALIERYGRDTMEEVFLDVARGTGRERGPAALEAAR